MSDFTEIEREEVAVPFVRLGRIGPTCDELAAEHAPDETRPSLEHYRRHDEIDLLLPI